MNKYHEQIHAERERRIGLLTYFELIKSSIIAVKHKYIVDYCSQNDRLSIFITAVSSVGTPENTFLPFGSSSIQDLPSAAKCSGNGKPNFAEIRRRRGPAS